MIQIQSTVVIKRPIQEVWDFVSDCANEPQWHTDCSAARMTSRRRCAPAQRKCGR